MSGETPRSPIEWIFRASLLLLGAIIALNIAVTFLRPILPWLIGGCALATVGWAAVAIIRWRRSRWLRKQKRCRATVVERCGIDNCY